MKKILLIAVVALLAIMNLNAQETVVKPYLRFNELPNLLNCLPPHPAFNSPEFADDVLRYQWGKRQRADADRLEVALHDSPWDLDSLFSVFSEAFGMKISRENTPEIWKMLETSIVTIDTIRKAPKNHYKRERPFEYYGENVLPIEDERWLRGEGSYPSGHTLRGTLVALLLIEVNPENADAIFRRGWDYGDSRIILGAHWHSDVEASRAAASIGYAVLQTSDDFRAQMEKAKAEFAKKK